MAKEIGEKKNRIKDKVRVEPEDVAKVFAKEAPLANKRIYVGPGKPGLITNTVYSGGYPVFVSAMIEECPAIEKLMVKIPDYATAKLKVKKKGTIEYENAQRVLSYIKGEGGNE